MTTTEYERNLILSSVDYNVVGTRPVRHDGADKVTGRALYGADFDTAGLLHGKILRSPHAHANIKNIDTSKAEALPGVLAAVTFDDFPQVDNAALDLGEEVTTLHDLQANILARTRRCTRDTRLRQSLRPMPMSPKKRSSSSRWSMKCFPRL